MWMIWAVLTVLTVSIVLLWVEMGYLRREVLETRLDVSDLQIEARQRMVKIEEA